MTASFPYPTVIAAQEKDLFSVRPEVVRDALRGRGAILVKGYDFGVDAFSRWTKGIMSPAVHGSNDTPETAKIPQGGRRDVTADKTVQTVNQGFAEFGLHSELAYVPNRPDVAIFCCVTPAEAGGQTTIADGVVVFERLQPKTQKVLLEKRVTFHHRYTRAVWQRTFGAATREEVMPFFEMFAGLAASRGEHIAYGFRKEAEHLFKGPLMPEADAHPDDIWLAYSTPSVMRRRDGTVAYCQALHQFARTNFERGPAPTNTAVMRAEEFRKLEGLETSWACFEDGAIVSDEILNDLEATLMACEVPVEWEKGDIVAIDNWRTLHGRRGHTDKKRDIHVSWGYADCVEKLGDK